MLSLIHDLKTFAELDTYVLYELGSLRQAVLVVEQNCPYQDLDGKDLHSHHLMAYTSSERKEIVAYCRIVPPGLSYENEVSIGRVLTPLHLRKMGYGKILVQEAIKSCQKLYPNTSIRISAQTYLLKFYQDLGFIATDIAYLEDNIPHTEMYYPI